MASLKKITKDLKNLTRKVTKATSKITGKLTVASSFIPVIGGSASKVLELTSKITGKANELLNKTNLKNKLKNVINKVKEEKKTIKNGYLSIKQTKSEKNPKRSEYNENLTPSQKTQIDQIKSYIETYNDESNNTEVCKQEQNKKQSFWDWFINGKKEH